MAFLSRRKNSGDRRSIQFRASPLEPMGNGQAKPESVKIAAYATQFELADIP